MLRGVLNLTKVEVFKGFDRNDKVFPNIMGMLKIDVWERRGSEGFGEGFEGDEVVFLFAVFLIKMFFLSALKIITYRGKHHK